MLVKGILICSVEITRFNTGFCGSVYTFFATEGKKILNIEQGILTIDFYFYIQYSLFNIRYSKLLLKQTEECTIHFTYDIAKMFFVLGEFIFIAVNYQ